MRASNGYLSYEVNDKEHRHDLWIMSIEQPQQLSGDQKQSRTTRHFYPRGHMPGDFTISGNCESQSNYQSLARFIRAHHSALLDQPSTETFTRGSGAGYKRLMKLSIPTEAILIRGFVPRFTLTKHGVFEPAPPYSFPFVVIYDTHSTDIHLSQEITKYFSGGVDRVGSEEEPESISLQDLITQGSQDNFHHR